MSSGKCRVSPQDVVLFLSLHYICKRTDWLAAARGAHIYHCALKGYAAFGVSQMYVFATLFYTAPWRRVLLEQLTGPQLVTELPAFYGTPKVQCRVHNSSKNSW